MQKKLFLKSLLAVMMISASAFLSAETYSYEFAEKQFGTSGEPKDLGGINWTIDAVKSDLATQDPFFGYDKTKGQQFGSAKGCVSSAVLSTSDIQGSITSVTVETSGASSIEGTVAVKVGGEEFGTTVALTATSTPYTFNGSTTGNVEIIWTNSSAKAIYVKSIQVEYATGEVKVMRPVASVAEGSYYEPISVELTCETEGTGIYYTLDGTDPTVATGTEYSAPIEITSTTTLKAIAVNDANETSSILTAEYVFPVVEEVENIAAFIQKADAENNVRIKGTVTVTYSDGDRNHFIKDESGVLMIYGTAKGLVNGSTLTGIVGKYELYNTTVEIKPVYVPTPAEGNTIDPVEVTIKDINFDKINEYVILKNVELDADITFSSTEKVRNTTIVEEDVTIGGFDKFNALDNESFKAGVKYDITAIIGEYNPKDGDKVCQLYLISIADHKPSATESVNIKSIVYSHNRTIVVETEESNAVIEVFSVTGKRISTVLASSDITVIEGIEAGVNIVRVNNTIHKVIVK